MALLCPRCREPLTDHDGPAPAVACCPGCGFRLHAEIAATEHWSPGAAGPVGPNQFTLPEPAAPATGRPDVAGYEILAELGRGGVGVVYKARQTSLNRLVALKMILAGGHAGAVERARFHTEAEAVARLQHPGIVQIFEVGESEGRPFLALELVEGGSLAERLAGTPLPAREAAQLLETLARAVHAAHLRGVIHRDLKPANVLLASAELGARSAELATDVPALRVPRSEFRAPKITDFGLAKQLDAQTGQTQSGAILGTPSYMAPEQAAGRGKDIGPTADVYALGAILYECLTGRPPFKAATSMETLLQVLSEEPVPPTQLQPKVPHDLETVCLKCLQKEPSRRYASAEELADDVGRCLRDEPIHARPVGPVERLGRWCRRNPRLAGLTATVAGLLVAGAVGSLLVTLHIAGVNADLVRARDEADQNAAEREAAQHREAEERGRAEEQLVQLYVHNGLRAADEGDLLGALPWLTRALARDSDDPGHRLAHRTRLAAVLRECPRLLQLWHHDAAVSGGTFSPDGGRVALISGSTVRVWDTGTGQPVTAPLMEADDIRHVGWSPDGSRLLLVTRKGARLWEIETATATGDVFAPAGAQLLQAVYTAEGPRAVSADSKGVQVWDLATRQPLGPPLPQPDTPHDALLSPDGRRLVITGSFRDPSFRIWDVATGKPLSPPLQHPGTWFFHAAFSADSRLLVTARDDNTARLWDAATGRALVPPLAHGGWVLDAAFSPDGRRLLTGDSSNTARLWDTVSGQPLGAPLPNRAAVLGVAFSPDGRRMATCSGNVIQRSVNMQLAYKLARLSDARVWDVATGKLAASPLTHEDSVLGVVFSPEGRRLLTVGSDHTARLWDLAPERLLDPVLPHAHAVSHAEFSPDGHAVVTAGGHDIHTGDPRTWRIPRIGEGRVWDLASVRPITPILKHDLILYAAAFSPDGRRVVTGGQDQSAQVWDARSGQPIGPRLKHGSEISTVAFTADGRYVITMGWDRMAKLWNAATGNAVRLPALHWDVSGATPGRVAAYSSDARQLLTISDEGAGLWDAASGALDVPLLRHGEKIGRAVFGADGRRVLTAGASQTAVWDTATGQLAGPPLQTVTAADSPTLSPDGSRLLGYNHEGSARVWDVATGEALSPPLRLGSPVIYGVFSPDSRFVLTCTQDATARLWDARTGLPVSLPLSHRAEVQQAAFSPDGRRVVTASRDRTARVWDVSAAEAPRDDLTALARLLSGRHVDASGDIVAVSAAELRDAWHQLQPRYPELFATPAAVPDLWDRFEARACEEGANWSGAVLHLDRLLAAGPDADLFVRRGNAHAELTRWDRAAADYDRASPLKPADRELAGRHALLCLGVGDVDGYRKACQGMLERFGQTKDPNVANSLAWSCSFAPDAVTDLAVPVRLAEQAVRSQASSYAYLNTLGSILYRAGRFEEANRKLQDAVRLQGSGGTGWDCLLMAMIQKRLGHAAEARQWLDKAVAWMKHDAADLTWENRLELQVLRQEAEQLLGDKPMHQ